VRFLATNDDGYMARGLAVMAEALAGRGEVVVVAPDRNRSGASNSLTLDSPLRVQRAENGSFFVNGTPTDCVHLAITGLLEDYPDMVISGINEGPNLGDDVLYSGTVAAAMEGRFLGLPALAVSLAGESPKHYESAARLVLELIDAMMARPLPKDTILNVNVPDLDSRDITGVETTRLGNRHKAEPAVQARDPKGLPIYWIGPPGAEMDAGPGTDFDAIRRRCVSVTPLHTDLTRYDALETVAKWLGSQHGDE